MHFHENRRGHPEHLKELGTHFKFGENWASFAQLVGPEEEEQATEDLRRLLNGSIEGKTFLDIGSGSGLSALAAARLGAGRILAVDIDPQSVSTTQALLGSRNLATEWEAREASVFSLDADQIGKFDIVYSWGVLHHTGSMWEAIDRATSLVSPNGMLVLAIYVKTPFCRWWRLEKRIYARSSPTYQRMVEAVWLSLLWLRRLPTRRRSGATADGHRGTHQMARGMDVDHDMRDWLGGYPYESASAAEVTEYVCKQGFVLERSFSTKPNIGVFGSGCAEYVFRRTN